MNKEYESAYSQVKALVEGFDKHRDYYMKSQYSEQQARKHFIDPFFEALGWTVNPPAGHNPYKQEVKIEQNLKIDHSQRFADYAFYHSSNYNTAKFYVEAKKPFVNIESRDNYFQIIRYGWNGHTPVGIITDFEQFHIIDCRYRPNIDDSLSRIIKKYYYTDYLDKNKFSEIYWLFSKEAIHNGSYDDYAANLPIKRGKSIQAGFFRTGFQTIDESFLEDIDEFRSTLARIFYDSDNTMDGAVITELTQRTIDRLIFLRFLEDKLIETNYRIADFIETGSTWRNFISASKRLDKIYNGIIFKNHNILDSDSFNVDDYEFTSICEELSHDHTPYDFDKIPVHILGSVYEQFLGKIVEVDSNGIKLVLRPEARKSGGVYYTPEYIVQEIIENTIAPLIEGRTPTQIEKLRFGDIACGSGSFLIAIYAFILDYHRNWYNDYPEKAKKNEYFKDDQGALRLTLEKKKNILLNNIWGVDIDYQAIEVAQMSLFLKLLEEETTDSAHQYLLEFEHERQRKQLLPSLSENIKCGNSLIDQEFYTTHDITSIDAKSLERINVFDWGAAFPRIFGSKTPGFDAIVGNPPYIRIQDMTEYAPVEAAYYKDRYVSAGAGNFDIYVTFVEKALDLLNKKGRMGYILPHKFFSAKYGKGLRKIISNGGYLSEIVNFGWQQVFKGATTYTCLLFLDIDKKSCFRLSNVEDMMAYQTNSAVQNTGSISIDRVTDKEWCFIANGQEIFDHLFKIDTKLEDVTSRIFQGIKTSADNIYIVDKTGVNGKNISVYSKQNEQTYDVEPDLFHPLAKGGDSKAYKLSTTKRHILFPYERNSEGAMGLISASDLKSKYPLTWRYLNDNKKYLENRERGRMRNDKWFAYGRTQALDVISLPKIFTPDIAPIPSYSIDLGGEIFFTGGAAGGYGILPKEGVSPLYLLGLLNSNLLFWLLKPCSTPMRGGWYSFESRFISRLPIIYTEDHDSEIYREQINIESLVKRLLTLNSNLTGSLSDHKKNMLEQQIVSTKIQIDTIVYGIYGLSQKEIKIVEG